jgi:uncharacterized SAM-binding protein YcdF (DUF218 family)
MTGPVAFFLQPYTLFVLLTGLGLANLWRRRRDSRGRLALVSAPYAVLVGLSLPISGYLALGSLEWGYPPPPAQGSRPDAQAVVVLAGNIAPPDSVRRQAELGHTTVYRCAHAAELYHQGAPLSVLVCGGLIDPSAACPPAAVVMRDFLVEMGVRPADVMVEPGSQTTHQNAVEAAKVLRRYGLGKVILVTEASHMPRAARCFRKQGIEVVPSACRYRATRFDLSPFGFLPTINGAQGCLDAFHEWLGLAWYWLRGYV